MAGRAGPGPTMLASGKLPQPDSSFPLGQVATKSGLIQEGEIFQKERRNKQEAIALGYEQHGNQSRAIKDAGVPYQTFNEWLHKDATFQERMLQAHKVWRESLQSKLYTMVDTQETKDHPNPVPIIFALKGNWPEKYGDRIKVEDSRLDRLLEMTKRQGELGAKQRGEWIEGEVVPPALGEGSDATDS